MFVTSPGARRKQPRPPPAFAGPRGECEGCQRGDGRVTCTCIVQDRCSATDADGRQCILGAGHTLKHVLATGKHWL